MRGRSYLLRSKVDQMFDKHIQIAFAGDEPGKTESSDTSHRGTDEQTQSEQKFGEIGVDGWTKQGTKMKKKRHEPLPTADSTTTRVLLLFLHFFEHGVLLDLDEVLALLLSETEPEVFDALAFLGGARAPYLAGTCLALLACSICPGLACI